MTYPFKAGLKNLEDVAYKLKVLAVAKGVTVIEMVRRLVEEAYRNLSDEHRKLAEKVVGDSPERKEKL